MKEKKNSHMKNWGNRKNNCMSKVRNFSEIAPNIAFPEFNFYDLYRSTFEIGRGFAQIGKH